MYNAFYDNIILGGTYSAMGFCCGNRGNNLIISKNIFIEDYSPAFRFGKVFSTTEEGKKLLERLDFNNGLVNIGQASIEMYKMAEQQRLSILYQTFVSEVKKQVDGWSIKVHNWDGANLIKCKNLIHTQPVNNMKRKTLNALVEGELATGNYDGYEIAEAFYDGQKVLRLQVDTEDAMDTARLKLFEMIHTDALQTLRLILVANEFDYRVASHGANEIPSCNYDNLIESFEAGYKLGAMV